MRSPKDFFRPLALGAPEPVREVPVRPSRVIHFFPPSNAKMVAKVPDIAPTVDILLANLEDGVPASDKEAARAGLVEVGKNADMGDTQLWTRVNSLDSPWALDDLTAAVGEIGDTLDVIMIPKVEGPEDIHYVDRLLAQLEARAGLSRPILVHAILETARGMANVEEICGASPRMQGPVARPRRPRRQPAHEDHAGGRWPSRLPRPAGPAGRRPGRAARHLPAGPVALHDRPHGRRLRHARAAAVLRALRRHQGHGRLRGPVPQRLPPRVRGRVEPHPVQIEIAKRVFSPDPAEVAHAQRVIEAMGDGTGAVMLDGKMEDDASVKQCRVVVDLARALADRDPELASAYDLARS
jgi:malyl-CoA/(S)-citramalyl-CoA lyase